MYRSPEWGINVHIMVSLNKSSDGEMTTSSDNLFQILMEPGGEEGVGIYIYSS